MRITGIDHVQLAAPEGCEPEARRFFGELLGFEELKKPEPLRFRGGCWFRVGDRQLHIGVEAPVRPATKAHPAFSVEDIETLFAELQRHGVRCAWDEALGGTRRFYASDPWGNRLEFTDPTFRQIDARRKSRKALPGRRKRKI
ncbi:MAG TPA: VOC family protein [Candidatus Acidoferrum sp.]|nr:VOC family protein [Candidatus Acidoferrum sp.]